MCTYNEFATAYLACPTERRNTWLDEMRASAHHLICLNIVATQMAGSEVGNSLREEIKHRSGP